MRTVLKHGTRVLVEKFNDHGIFVAQFVSSRIKIGWIFLNEADIQIIEDDQLLKRHIPVIYLQSECIQCQIDKNVVKNVENKLKKA